MEPTPNPGPDHPSGPIPKDLRGRASLALRVKEAWAANPQLVLIWITQTAFGTQATKFDASVTAREKAGQLRPQLSGTLRQLDAELEAGLNYVKGYIADKFTKARAKDYYNEFGIETAGDRYILPEGQRERLLAIDDLLAALTAHGFADRTYGTAYWTPHREAYATATGQATKTAQSVSKAIADRDPLEDEVVDVLQALLSLIDAQYRAPEARAAKRRELGFLEEFN